MHKQGLGVAVPVHARGATSIILCAAWLRLECSHLLKMQGIISQKENRRRSLEQVAIARAGGHADRQAKHSRVSRVGFVEESVAAQLALRRAFADVLIRGCGQIAKAHCGEMQVLAVRAYYDGVRAHLLYPVGSMRERERIQVAIRPTHDIET